MRVKLRIASPSKSAAPTMTALVLWTVAGLLPPRGSATKARAIALRGVATARSRVPIASKDETERGDTSRVAASSATEAATVALRRGSIIRLRIVIELLK